MIHGYILKEPLLSAICLPSSNTKLVGEISRVGDTTNFSCPLIVTGMFRSQSSAMNANGVDRASPVTKICLSVVDVESI